MLIGVGAACTIEEALREFEAISVCQNEVCVSQPYTHATAAATKATVIFMMGEVAC